MAAPTTQTDCPRLHEEKWCQKAQLHAIEVLARLFQKKHYNEPQKGENIHTYSRYEDPRLIDWKDMKRGSPEYQYESYLEVTRRIVMTT
jgi:hypothetical protein